MKHNHNHDNAPSAIHPLPVRFEFKHPTAASVSVAGSFNDWKPEAKTLHSSGGFWWKETVLNPGTYEYCFVVDGQWIPDPQSKETVANPFGGRNSVLKVEAPAASTTGSASAPPPQSATKAEAKTATKAAANDTPPKPTAKATAKH